MSVGHRLPSPQEIADARTALGGWRRETLAQWGVPWPPPKGWRKRLIEQYEDAVDCRIAAQRLAEGNFIGAELEARLKALDE